LSTPDFESSTLSQERGPVAPHQERYLVISNLRSAFHLPKILDSEVVWRLIMLQLNPETIQSDTTSVAPFL